MTISKVPLRTHSALLSVALAAALAGCGSAPTKPAFAPGYTPTEAEMGLAEQNSATALPSSTAAELKSKGVLPYYTDTRLLYLAALQRQGALNPDDHHHVDIGKYLDRANLAAHLFGVGKFALDPPLISLLSIGTSTTSRRDYGPQYARNILRLPSLTLVGTHAAGGDLPGTPAYGARLDSLFTQADTLVRAVSLNCRPEAASLAQIRQDELCGCHGMTTATCGLRTCFTSGLMPAPAGSLNMIANNVQASIRSPPPHSRCMSTISPWSGNSATPALPGRLRRPAIRS